MGWSRRMGHKYARRRRWRGIWTLFPDGHWACVAGSADYTIVVRRAAAGRELDGHPSVVWTGQSASVFERTALLLFWHQQGARGCGGWAE